MNQPAAPTRTDVIRRAADIASQALEGTALGNAAVGNWVYISGPVAEVLGTKISAALSAENILADEPRGEPSETTAVHLLGERRRGGQAERAYAHTMTTEQASCRAQLEAVDRFLSTHSHIVGGPAGEAGAYLDALRELRHDTTTIGAVVADTWSAEDVQGEPAVGASVRTAAGRDWFRTKKGWVDAAVPCGRPRTWGHVTASGPVRRLWADFAEIPVGTSVADRDDEPITRTAMNWRESLAISENRGPFTSRAPIGVRDE